MSALDFWRLVYSATRTLGAPSHTPALANGLAVNAPDVWTLAPQWVTPSFLAPEGGVLHVLARSPSDRRVSSTHVVHQWTSPIPEGSLYGFGDGTYVCSPAFAFLQMAAELDLIELIALGYELCGTYLFDERESRGFRTRKQPLLTPEQLSQFLASAKGTRNQRKAARATRYLAAGSASPRETLTSMLLTLPCNLGGYGLPRLELNHRIDLTPRAKRLCRRSFLKADLYHPTSKLIVEYLGEHDHAGASSLQSDRSRTNALAEMGYEVIELTSSLVNDAFAFDAIALQIARQMHERIRAENRGTSPSRAELRRTLHAWNEASGRRASRAVGQVRQRADVAAGTPSQYG